MLSNCLQRMFKRSQCSQVVLFWFWRRLWLRYSCRIVRSSAHVAGARQLDGVNHCEGMLQDGQKKSLNGENRIYIATQRSGQPMTQADSHISVGNYLQPVARLLSQDCEQ